MKSLQALCTKHDWQKIVHFVQLVLDVNTKINLVSRKDTDRIWEHHIAPCFAFKILDRIQPNEYILDIGSGGGLPGIVNAILFPDTEFLMVDSTQKKVKVLESFIKELDLTNISALWARVEDLHTEEYLHTFDRTTSRAVAPMKDLIRWSAPLLKTNGWVEALKGGDLHAELESLSTPYTIHTLPEEFRINEKMATAAIVSVQVT